jgi:hypothetical protein
MIRELDSRTDTFVTVSLLWDDSSNEVFVEISTDGDSELFPVPADEASQAFQHPFVYQTRNYSRRSVAV